MDIRCIREQVPQCAFHIVIAEVPNIDPVGCNPDEGDSALVGLPLLRLPDHLCHFYKVESICSQQPLSEILEL